MKWLTILLLLMTTALANDPRLERKDWSLIVKTENGTVSILKNLSLSEVGKSYDALEPSFSPGFHYVSGNEVRQRTIIGPDGWDGCRKAMNHQYDEDAYELIEETSYRPKGDPHIGMYFHFVRCRFCKQSDPNKRGDYVSQKP